jgi:hemerythrin-like domain-containing protein
VIPIVSALVMAKGKIRRWKRDIRFAIAGGTAMNMRPSKRHVLLAGAAVAGAAAPALLLGPAAAQQRSKMPKEPANGKEEEVTPPEDLMREHGVLDRVLLLYEAAIRKFASNADFDPGLITQSAQVIRDFINDYHEKSEETYVFPRFKKAGQLTELVDTLLRQHEAGRNVTQTIIRLAPTSRSNNDDRPQLVASMRSFIDMYRPHAAREDTELFPKLQKLVSPHEYDAMAEQFEKEEHKRFGEDGFEKVVARVAQLEQQMGIHNLDQFTPR